MKHREMVGHSQYTDPPRVAQNEMIRSAKDIEFEATQQLTRMIRKDDPEAYDKVVADIRYIREVIKNIETFGPGA